MTEKKEQKYTIVKGSEREFNIRWWGWGLSAFAIGVFLGIVLGTQFW